MTALAAWMGRGTVPVRPEYRRIAVFVAMAALMYGVLMQIQFPQQLTTLLVRMVAGAAIYAVGTVLLDGETRALAQQALGRFGLFRGKA